MTHSNRPAAPVPQGRLIRLAHLGGLAGRITGSLVTEGARQIARGRLPNRTRLFLTPANARHITEKLSQLRGAAMKVGQLLSMDAGDILPAELTTIMARLRADAMPMPMRQVVDILQSAVGDEWQQLFKRFSFSPIAAASIGQVHRAISHDDRHLALKIQYPGIRRSIDSDVDNVARLLAFSGLLPNELDLGPLLDEAKRQLHQEADYLREAQHLREYSENLHDSADFLLPRVDENLTRENILPMDYLDGLPIESVTKDRKSVRDRVSTLLIDLSLREIFEFRQVQTDPNFANFQFHPDTQQIGLLDFGATRKYAATTAEACHGLLHASLTDNRSAMMEHAESLGYLGTSSSAQHRELIMTMMTMATEPARMPGRYDFAGSDLARRLTEAGMALSLEHGYWHTPPADMLFLHRKLGGLYLLAAHLRASIDVRNLLETRLDI